MKILLRSVPITSCNTTYTCDLLLGLYQSSLRPSLLLTVSQPASFEDYAPIAVPTTNPPPGYLTGFPAYAFCFKTWAENEGLLEQLLPLVSSSGNPLFIRALSREERPVSLTLGFCKAPVCLLANEALDAFNLLLKEHHDAS